MDTKETIAPKVHVCGGKLIREKIAVRDGDELEVTVEGGRIVLTPPAERFLPSELEVIREGEEEFAGGRTRLLDDLQHEIGLPIMQPRRTSLYHDAGPRPRQGAPRCLGSRH